MSKSFLRLSLLCAPLLLSACGDGWEAQRTTEYLPYGDQRTAGSGVVYVRAKMMPKKELNVEPVLEEVASTPPTEVRPVLAAEEIFEDAQEKGSMANRSIRATATAPKYTETVANQVSTEVTEQPKTNIPEAAADVNNVTQQKINEALNAEPVQATIQEPVETVKSEVNDTISNTVSEVNTLSEAVSDVISTPSIDTPNITPSEVITSEPIPDPVELYDDKHTALPGQRSSQLTIPSLSAEEYVAQAPRQVEVPEVRIIDNEMMESGFEQQSIQPAAGNTTAQDSLDEIYTSPF